ncbi:MAG TPA: LEA type 2 family protein [Verrucomicrobiae bacterium]|nr:LEA type 2 family protein [Verrucomicrobiae bacterium]
MRHAILATLLLLMLSLTSGCSLFVSKPEVTFNELKIVGADTSGMSFDLLLTVNNPNRYDITLDGYTYDLRISDLQLANGGIRDRKVFAGKQESEFRIPVRITYKDVLQIIKHRPDPDNIPYQFDSGLELRTGIGPMYVPLHKTGSFAVPEEYRHLFYIRKLRDLFNFEKPADAVPPAAPPAQP